MAKDTLPEVAADVRNVRANVEKLDQRVEKAAVDIHQIQETLVRHDARFDTLEIKLDRGFAEVRDGLAEIRSIIKGLTGAITEAVTQLALSRSFEKRLDRLETEVFGAKL